MTDETIRPALTPEEWEADEGVVLGNLSALRWRDRSTLSLEPIDDDESIRLDPSQRHALAALCLHGQPFGFTDEDVEIIDALLVVLGRSTDPTDSRFYGPYLTSLRDRIAALLPPESP